MRLIVHVCQIAGDPDADGRDDYQGKAEEPVAHRPRASSRSFANDSPSYASGRATFGAKLYSAELAINGVFGAVPLGAWVAFWTPYKPGVGQVNAAGTVASPAAIAPGAVTLRAKKAGLGATVSGKVTQAGQARGGATVAISGGPTAGKLKKLGSVKANASGNYTFRAKKGVFFKATAAALPASAPPLCTALAPALAPVPCVNPTTIGFTAQTKAVKKK